jgi:uncharacterized membrane protein YdbT with pleckstrin-like domain
MPETQEYVRKDMFDERTLKMIEAAERQQKIVTELSMEINRLAALLSKHEDIEKRNEEWRKEVRDEIKEVKDELFAMKMKPAKSMEKIKDKVVDILIGAIVGGAIMYIISALGLFGG